MGEEHSCITFVVPAQAGTQSGGLESILHSGVTSDLIQPVWQHNIRLAERFTNSYGVNTLVWYEAHDSMKSAIAGEKAQRLETHLET